MSVSTSTSPVSCQLSTVHSIISNNNNMPPPHSSTSSHIATETALLTTLYNRSKAQHRSQLFLSRLRGVLRLAKLVLATLPSTSTSFASGVAGPASASSALPQLLGKFTTSLLHAAAASNAILELHHFVPLHTTLLAAYARLLGITLALGSSVDLSVDVLISGSPSALATTSRSATTCRVTEQTPSGAGDGDVGDVVGRDHEGLGVKIDRASLSASRASTGSQPTPSSTPKASKATAMSKPEDMDMRDGPATRSDTVPTKKQRRDKVAPSDMDDIFGHSSQLPSTAGTKGERKRKSDAEDGARKKAKAVDADNLQVQQVDVGSEPTPKPKPSKTKRKEKEKDSLDDIFGETKPKKKKNKSEGMDDGSKPKKTKKKSKKGGEMEDIFGF